MIWNTKTFGRSDCMEQEGKHMDRIILASASPRRKEILSQAGISFEVVAADHEEKSCFHDPEELVKDLAAQKAEAAADLLKGESSKEETAAGYVVIGADTVVALHGQILGKPKDEKDAFRMLSKLQGSTHQVYTGVSLLRLWDGRKEQISFAEATYVSIAPMSSEEIRRYIATKEPMDKAGSYAIQGKFARYIERIKGDYYNVVGFPLHRFCVEAEKAWNLLV